MICFTEYPFISYGFAGSCEPPAPKVSTMPPQRRAGRRDPMGIAMNGAGDGTKRRGMDGFESVQIDRVALREPTARGRPIGHLLRRGVLRDDTGAHRALRPTARDAGQHEWGYTRRALRYDTDPHAPGPGEFRVRAGSHRRARIETPVALSPARVGRATAKPLGFRHTSPDQLERTTVRAWTPREQDPARTCGGAHPGRRRCPIRRGRYVQGEIGLPPTTPLSPYPVMVWLKAATAVLRNWSYPASALRYSAA